ncbi:MAG TPA: hypothetical protein VFO21_11405 [Vicinamibacterales bacterium]|nr:hypothetical protein [Vicinamibacterales bacterium]
MGIWPLAVFMMAASQATVPPAADRSVAPDPALVTLVSVERIHDGLQRPELKIPPPVEFVPVFRATIDERLFETPLQGMRRELAEDSGYRGRAGVDVLALAMGVVKSIKGAYRAHSEARIRKEVQEALDAFCAEHDCSVLADGPPPMEGIVLPRRRRD